MGRPPLGSATYVRRASPRLSVDCRPRLDLCAVRAIETEAWTEVHAPGSHPPPPIFQIHVAPAAARSQERRRRGVGRTASFDRIAPWTK